ncbi:Pentapeptide repeat family protein [Desulfovibrio sp. DV]|uniref:pentapeptide repeat-containing protein n=1 Tax=Desulfovibrio sp. DV TaxID=1844708 RepID=UPI00095CA490|nr:pentapeptide repeat-containing protein [Desulfovibrio sp. DV]OLN27627.1 Pentapeptide repeat family protein [Desulfovibrio sp. DV]
MVVFFIGPLALMLIHLNLTSQYFYLTQNVLLLDQLIVKHFYGMTAEQEEERSLHKNNLLSNLILDRDMHFSLGLFMRFVLWFFVVCAPISLFLLFQSYFIPYHDQVVIWMQRVVLLIDVSMILLLWPAISGAQSRNCLSRQMANISINPLDTIKRIPITALYVFFLVIPLCFILLTIPGESLDTFRNEFLRIYASSIMPNIPFPNNNNLDVHNALLIKSGVSQEVLSQFAGSIDKHDAVLTDLVGKYGLGLKLKGRDLRDANLSGALLPHAILEGAQLVNARLSGAHLECAKLYGVNLVGADLANARLACADVIAGAGSESQSIRYGGAAGAKLQGADLRYAHLEGALLIGAHLEGALLTGAHLEGANLGGAYLNGADLSGANLDGASLDGCKLVGLQAEKASFRSASLPITIKDSNFRGANFKPFSDQEFKVFVAEVSQRVPSGRRKLFIEHLEGSRHKHIKSNQSTQWENSCHEESCNQNMLDSSARARGEILTEVVCSYPEVADPISLYLVNLIQSQSFEDTIVNTNLISPLLEDDCVVQNINPYFLKDLTNYVNKSE